MRYLYVNEECLRPKAAFTHNDMIESIVNALVYFIV